MLLRYGHLPLGEISWLYLPAGTGTSLAGYKQRQLNAGPNGKGYTFQFLERGQQFFSRLKASVAAEGIRNPVFVLALEEGVFIRYGGSRIWAAHELQLETVPAVCADWVGRYPDWEVLATEADVLAKYRDTPATVNLDPADLQILHCPHSHLPGSPTNPGKIVNDKYKRFADQRRVRGRA